MRTGVDMVDVARFRRVADAGEEKLFERLFRPDEISAFSSPRELAMVFALKEAVSKALGTGIAEGVSWHDIQVLSSDCDGHSVVLHGTAERLAGGGCIHVSADSTDTLAVAFAILDTVTETEEDRQ